ncbi:MAG: hypothetical protein ATN31_06280 [Candidatus Epulonipiscioides saccharophilum]|nr:MAG: hypothetical protein ATN31_06280 [Epulopiscium sp. AS2M-Bin001]
MNIVFIMSDQQNKNALGKINPQYITPNLDRLANDGVLFKNAYTPSPVCLACRNCLMTGKFPSTTGIRRAKDRPRDQDIQLNALMKQSGYNTAYVGKYHLAGGGNGPIPDFAKKGIDQMMAYQCYNGFKPEPPFNNKVVYRDVDNIETHFDYHRTEVTTDLALNFIEDLSSKSDPLYIFLSKFYNGYPIKCILSHKFFLN